MVWFFNSLCITLNLILSMAVLPASCVIKTRSFGKVLDLENRVGTVGILLDSQTRSFLACTLMCASRCCLSFTFVRGGGGSGGQCLGYGVVRHSLNTTVPTPGARTLTWPDAVSGTGVNVALHKNATQSGVVRLENAAFAVDGNKDTMFSHGSCSHTDTVRPVNWWQVDLQGHYVIQSVYVTNRGDCCAERLRDFYVHVYLNDPSGSPAPEVLLCRYRQGAVGLGVTEELPCSQYGLILGRFVRITNNPFSVLSLCEVEVKARPCD